LKFSFIRHFATKITIYVFDEKNNIKKLRLSAKHKPLNVDAKINQHLRSIFFFSSVFEKSNWEEMSARRYQRSVTADSFQLCCTPLPLCLLKWTLRPPLV